MTTDEPPTTSPELQAKTEPKLWFRPRHRLTHALQFKAVYDARVRKHRGPITVFALPNGLSHCRLGLSVGRKFGNAVQRNAFKRRMREAFRLSTPGLPGPPDAGLDLIITVRPHTVLKTAQYQEALLNAAQSLAKEWAKRQAKAGAEPPPKPLPKPQKPNAG